MDRARHAKRFAGVTACYFIAAFLMLLPMPSDHIEAQVVPLLAVAGVLTAVTAATATAALLEAGRKRRGRRT